MKVLIADDDPVSRRLLQNYLQKWGHEVVATVNGAEAWRHLQVESFPVVISDWMMPEMDGLQLVGQIRAHPRPGPRISPIGRGPRGGVGGEDLFHLRLVGDDYDLL